MRETWRYGTAILVGRTDAVVSGTARMVGDHRAHQAGGKAYGYERNPVADGDEKNASPPHPTHGSIHQGACQITSQWPSDGPSLGDPGASSKASDELDTVRRARLVLHLSWEMAQMPLYRGVGDGSWWATIPTCSRAALFDVGVSLAIVAPFRHVARRRPSARGAFSGMLPAGAFVAIAIGKAGVLSGRWAYADSMPLLPWLRVGILPVVQMMLIPWVSFRLALNQRDDLTS